MLKFAIPFIFGLIFVTPSFGQVFYSPGGYYYSPAPVYVAPSPVYVYPQPVIRTYPRYCFQPRYYVHQPQPRYYVAPRYVQPYRSSGFGFGFSFSK